MRAGLRRVTRGPPENFCNRSVAVMYQAKREDTYMTDEVIIRIRGTQKADGGEPDEPLDRII